MAKFQFTHPGGVRHHILAFRNYYARFQFTHPGGVRRLLISCKYSAGAFQFTHPGGVRRREGRRSSLFVRSFNSRTREGCDLMQTSPYN